ncbi:SRPBCC family protein [Actinoplanes sp. CA-015351]|uniref:SRPBCC family protein n=1 Tax=Actinoplanes sp. CA-015351 TaxID=3239897 RepID=UPI003D98ACA0
MPVVSAVKDVDTLTMTFVAEFEASVERVWQVWADPRKLERWWGPPTVPATFERFEFEPGGQVRYYMTVPDGTKARGWWTMTAIEAPRHLEFDFGFADENNEPVDPKDCSHGVVTLEGLGERTRMTLVSGFTSAEQLERMAEMGMMEGMRLAQNQIDDLLA